MSRFVLLDDAQPTPPPAAQQSAPRFKLLDDWKPQPKPSLGFLDILKDVGEQGVRRFNKGLVEAWTIPYRVLDWAAEKVTGGGGLPDVETMPLYRPFLEQPDAKSTPGRYVGKAAEAVGAATVPVAGMMMKAAQPAKQAATTMGSIVEDAVAFARANPGQALALDAAGSASSGVAAQAAEDAGAGPTGQVLAAIAGGMAPGVAMAYRTPTTTRIGTQTGETMARQRATEAATDAAAFDAQDVRPFGPAFNQGPVASVGKQATETPLVGAPLRNNLDETMADAAAATRRIADEISPNATPETAGLAVQRGLDRYRDVGFEQLEPGVVRGLGINPDSPVQRPQGGGQAQLARIQQGQPLVQQITGGTVQNTRGQPVPLPQTRAQKLTARTTVADLSDDELARVVRTPSDVTSFGTRLEALYERAFRGIPPLMRSDGSRNPNLLPTANAGQVVRSIIDDEATTGVRAGLQGRYGQMFETLANPRANADLDTLRAMRTAIGRDLSNFGLYDASLDRTQLRRLYAALSSDIEIGLQDIAARAAQATRLPGNNRLSAADARRASQALRDMQVADRYARQGFERMDRFLQIVRTPNPQSAATQIIRSATDGGGGNMRLVRSAMSVLRPEERAEFGALVIREMGRPTDSARGIVQEVQWSPTRFVTAYQRMSPEARALFFTPEHQRAINEMFRIANRLANVEALANTSRSATNAMNVTGAVGSVASAAAGDFTTPLAIGGSMLATSVLMSRPAYTRWMVQYMRLRAAVRDGSDRSIAPLLKHVSGLERMVPENPALWPAYYAVATDVEGLRKPAN